MSDKIMDVIARILVGYTIGMLITAAIVGVQSLGLWSAIIMFLKIVLCIGGAYVMGWVAFKIGEKIS